MAEFSTQMTNSGIDVINTANNNSHSESIGPLGPRFTAGNDLFDGSKEW